MRVMRGRRDYRRSFRRPAAAGRRSVAEVALTGEDHRHATLVGGGDDVGVPHAAAGLDERR